MAGMGHDSRRGDQARASGGRSRHRRDLLSPLAQCAGTPRRREGRHACANTRALPARLGSRRRPHAAWRTDRAAAGRLPSSRLANGHSCMTTATVGAAKLTRIEETYEPNFEARTFFTEWRDELVAPHLGWMVPNHFDPASGRLK